MKRWLVIFCLLVFLYPTNVNANASVNTDVDTYILGSGDLLIVSVFGIKDINIPELPVRPDGKISFPPIGEVKASGLSAEELSSKLEEKLSYYYESPHVTVIVNQFRTTRVYVVGQVVRPGFVELDKSHNIFDAIGAAQGWTQDALKTKVYIIRNGSKEKPLTVDLMDILKKGDTSKNYVLNDGDIVFLADNRRIDIVRDIMPLINPLWLINNWTSKP